MDASWKEMAECYFLQNPVQFGEWRWLDVYTAAIVV
jgi:hypothetical protein